MHVLNQISQQGVLICFLLQEDSLQRVLFWTFGLWMHLNFWGMLFNFIGKFLKHKTCCGARSKSNICNILYKEKYFLKCRNSKHNLWFLAHLSWKVKWFIKLEGGNSSFEKYSCEFEKKYERIKNQNYLQRLFGDLEINKIIQDALFSHDRKWAVHDCEKTGLSLWRTKNSNWHVFRFHYCVAAQ